MDWVPHFEITLATKQLVVNFVGTRARKFAQQTITKAKMRRKVFA